MPRFLVLPPLLSLSLFLTRYYPTHLVSSPMPPLLLPPFTQAHSYTGYRLSFVARDCPATIQMHETCLLSFTASPAGDKGNRAANILAIGQRTAGLGRIGWHKWCTVQHRGEDAAKVQCCQPTEDVRH